LTTAGGAAGSFTTLTSSGASSFATSSGNVGIGTNSPLAKLSVSDGGAASFEFIPNYVGLGVNRIQSFNRSTSAYVALQYDAADHRFEISGTERMRIDSSGRVGIGITPTQVLDVSSSDSRFNLTSTGSGQTVGISIKGGAGGGDTFNFIESLNSGGTQAWYVGGGGTANTLTFRTNGANERMRITSAGNVGIGTTNPSVALDVVRSDAGFISVDGGAGSGGGGAFRIRKGGADRGYIGIQGAILNTTSENLMIWSEGGSVATTFFTGGVERMRIESGGNLLVTTARSSARGRVDIPDVGGSQSVVLAISRGGDAGTMVNFYSTNSTTTTIGTIGNSGNTNTTYNTSSDYRLKENIVPMTGALGAVSALKPVTWTWKSTGADGQGFIAHELAEVIPDCVTGEKDAVDAEGNPEYQGIDTSYLVATLTAAIQEQQAIITDLKTRIELLEGTK
jgi:hypothetical protein